MPTGSSGTTRFIADTLTPQFVQRYYGHLTEAEAEGYSDTELAQRVEAHLVLGFERGEAQARIDVKRVADATAVFVVTDDMPFLVDSVVSEVVRQQYAITLVTHPTFIAKRRDEDGSLAGIEPVATASPMSSGDTAALPNLARLITAADEHTAVESWIAVEIAEELDAAQAGALVDGLAAALADVRLAVDDWQAMRSQAHDIAAELDASRDSLPVEGLDEAAELLRWLDRGHFTFLGYREYTLITHEGEDALEIQPESSLGLMRRSNPESLIQRLNALSQEHARELKPLVITKANRRSRVDRSVYLDYIGVKKFDAAGKVIGERRFIGLFASHAYLRSVREIPVVRQKVEAVRARAGFSAESHSGKDLVSILESYPRDELFQIEIEDLYATVMGILRLQERRVTRLFLRPDTYGRFMSALVFVPRDRYTTGVRRRIEAELKAALGAESLDFEVRMSESSLVRVFFRIRLPKGGVVPVVDQVALEARVARAVRSWPEGVTQALREQDAATARPIADVWANAFPAAYRVEFEVEDALRDIAEFALLDSPDHRGPVVRVEQVTNGDDGVEARLRLYVNEPMSLSRILPVLTNQGLEVIHETPFEVQRGDGRTQYLYIFGLRLPEGSDVSTSSELLGEAYRAVALGEAESDNFDRLILALGLTWQQVSILRAYATYLRQLGNPNSIAFMGDTLLSNPDVTRALVGVFEATFDPDLGDSDRSVRVAQAQAALAAGLDVVATLDADRLLRRFANLIAATLRTNYYVAGRSALAFKVEPARIDEAPLPRPAFEIWVYAPSVEGVHLRFGSVARGGLRWSDRREDFRTEVLGLVKAQVTKNAVIVPEGAKGGFFAKQLPDPAKDRAAWLAAGQDAYRTFIRALLSLTDNVAISQDGSQSVIPPKRVVRLDGDDTYLVVAADKGTATFSDIANEISLELGHWLGDAFASGGSVGYDHKAMGITARGAWESVKRHFSSLGHDTQSQDFTVVGVGDMSGDVFGNGMLLSEHIRLVAAFDHRHIFLDPNPDAAVSFAERRRLFELPRSSWADYRPELISTGGGVYPRQAKTIPISAEVRRALGLADDVVTLTPPELLRAILLAPVDLFYNGGIGTYIKGSAETHASVGDRANDAIRVDGSELRARVIAEGGNLGLTQLGRIEAAQHGVLVNTDAIDNSAGVDCSDHEVNIKILVDRLVAAGKLPGEERAAFIESMSDEVAALVLQTNHAQNVLLVNERQRIAQWNSSFDRFMDWLATRAGLDRGLEFLPRSAQLASRRGEGLTTPELSVLVAYAKLQLSAALTKAGFGNDPYFDRVLLDYFPRPLRERFGDEVLRHPLRNEIVSMRIANDIVNIGGITYAFRVIEEMNVSEVTVARAFVVLREVYDVDALLDAVYALPASFPTDKWSDIQLDLRRLLDRGTRWFASHVQIDDLQATVTAYKPTIHAMMAALGQMLRGADAERVTELYERALSWGAPEEIARRWSQQFESFPLLDITQAAAQRNVDPWRLAAVYFTVYDRYGIDALLERITTLPREDRWQALARAGLRDDVYATVLDIAFSAMEVGGAEGEALAAVSEWEAENARSLARVREVFDEVTEQGRDDMASLSVSLRMLRSIVRR